MTEFKTCPKCDVTFPLEDFGKAQNRLNHRTNRAYHSYCKTCCVVYAREWRKKRKNYKGTGKNSKVPFEDRELMSLIRSRISEAKGRHRKMRYTNDFDLDEDVLYARYKKQEGRCALLGHIMVVERKNLLCPSLDQIDPGKGYSLDNVQWVSCIGNRAKSTLSVDDFYVMCELALEWRKVQRLSKDAA